MQLQRNPWFVRSCAGSGVNARLYCFPYAGGSSAIYDKWAGAFDGVEIVALQMPGRGARIRERPLDSVAEIVAQLMFGIQELINLPFYFFGHSYGALIGFELARELQRRRMPGPRHVILSAKRAPHLPAHGVSMHDLPRERFIEELRLYNGTPAEILDNQDLMEMCLPCLRADFKGSETYRYHDDIKLDAQVSLFGGDQDRLVPERDMLKWCELVATDEVAYSRFDGDHFFIHSQEQLVLKEISRIVSNGDSFR